MAPRGMGRAETGQQNLETEVEVREGGRAVRDNAQVPGLGNKAMTVPAIL